MSIKLSNQYLERDAIRAPHFFNGRLLSAEDLSAERDAQRRLLRQLGRAQGHGIATGLEVSGPIGGSTATAPTVTVSAGLALSREGRAIELNQAVEVSLLEPASSAATGAGQTPSASFGACGALSTSAYAAGKGVYLLTIAPAEGREGRAMASGLGNLNACCADKSVVEGVRFRLIRLPLSASDLNDPRLQNRLAHRCFGTSDPARAGFPANPFGPKLERYGLLDELRDGRLLDSEVPLALIHWINGSGTRFIDVGSVRRRVVRAQSSERWQAAISDRQLAEHEAMFSQFQAQIEGWTSSSPAVVRATDHFDYLPPAGVLPLDSPARSAFVDQQFFAGLKLRKKPLHIEGSRLSTLLRAALLFPPIELAKRELIWTYVVRENQQAAVAVPTTAPYLVFATGHMPNFGDPRYDVSKWGYANYYLSFGDAW